MLSLCSILFFVIFAANVTLVSGEELQAKILKLYSAVNSAASRKAVCIHTGTAKCDSDFDYCMLPVEGPNGKIAVALLLCLEKNTICDNNCQADYDECKDGDTPLAECYQEYVNCDTTCEQKGIQCQTDAMTAHYEAPDLFRCTTYRDVCVKSVAKRCSY